MLLMLLVVLRITEPRCAFVGASVSKICFMFFGSVHAFASLPGSCHDLFVQLCFVYSKIAIFGFALLCFTSFCLAVPFALCCCSCLGLCLPQACSEMKA